ETEGKVERAPKVQAAGSTPASVGGGARARLFAHGRVESEPRASLRSRRAPERSSLEQPRQGLAGARRRRQVRYQLLCRLALEGPSQAATPPQNPPLPRANPLRAPRSASPGRGRPPSSGRPPALPRALDPAGAAVPRRQPRAQDRERAGHVLRLQTAARLWP